MDQRHGHKERGRGRHGAIPLEMSIIGLIKQIVKLRENGFTQSFKAYSFFSFYMGT